MIDIVLVSLRCSGKPKFAYAEFSTVAYGMRSYSPELGRWINRDPIEEKGGINLHCFCQNSSLENFDFLGLEKECMKCCDQSAFNCQRVTPGEVLCFEMGVPKPTYVDCLEDLPIGNDDDTGVITLPGTGGGGFPSTNPLKCYVEDSIKDEHYSLDGTCQLSKCLGLGVLFKHTYKKCQKKWWIFGELEWKPHEDTECVLPEWGIILI